MNNQTDNNMSTDAFYEYAQQLVNSDNVLLVSEVLQRDLRRYCRSLDDIKEVMLR